MKLTLKEIIKTAGITAAGIASMYQTGCATVNIPTTNNTQKYEVASLDEKIEEKVNMPKSKPVKVTNDTTIENMKINLPELVKEVYGYERTMSWNVIEERVEKAYVKNIPIELIIRFAESKMTEGEFIQDYRENEKEILFDIRKKTMKQLDINKNYDINLTELQLFNWYLEHNKNIHLKKPVRKWYSFDSESTENQSKEIINKTIIKDVEKIRLKKIYEMSKQYDAPAELIKTTVMDQLVTYKKEIQKTIINKTLKQIDTNKDHHISAKEIRNYKTRKN